MKKTVSTFCFAVISVMILPTLIFAAPQRVKVVNNENKPVPVYNVADKQPFHSELHVEFDPTQLGGGGSITVPSDKRLVIEFVAGIAGVVTGVVSVFYIRTTVDGTAARYYLVPIEIGPSGPAKQWAVSQDARIYADPGTAVEIFVGNTLGGDGAFTASISGYLVDIQ